MAWEWVAGAAAAAGSAVSAGMTGYMNRRSEKMLREQWARDDTAMQRGRADMEAAGLNPAMMGGGSGAATSSAPIKFEAPQVDGIGIMNGILAGQQIKMGKKQLAFTDKEMERIDTEIKGMRIDNMDKLTRMDMLMNQHEWAANEEEREQSRHSINIQIMENEAAKIGYENTLLQQQEKLNKYGLTEADIRNNMLKLEEAVKSQGLQADLRTKQAQAAMQEILLEEARRTSEIYGAYDAPKNLDLSKASSWAFLLGNALGRHSPNYNTPPSRKVGDSKSSRGGKF